MFPFLIFLFFFLVFSLFGSIKRKSTRLSLNSIKRNAIFTLYFVFEAECGRCKHVEEIVVKKGKRIKKRKISDSVSISCNFVYTKEHMIAIFLMSLIVVLNPNVIYSFLLYCTTGWCFLWKFNEKCMCHSQFFNECFLFFSHSATNKKKRKISHI